MIEIYRVKYKSDSKYFYIEFILWQCVDITMDNNPVTIIVKAPNQQFEDQTIHCELSWTIKRLKGLLSEVYPSKPKTDEQKLIYSGQLLNDAIVLKDILRQYEGQDTHTVHLVLQPNQLFESTKSNKNMPQQPTQPDLNTDGLRQRNTSQTNSSQSDGLFRPQADWSNANFTNPQHVADMNRHYNEWVSQQLPSYNMMVEQIYRQYYNQYMNNVNQPNYMSQNGGMNNLPQMPYYPQNYFSTPNIYNSPVLQQQNNQPQPQVPQPQVAAQPQQVPQQPLPDQQPNAAQQRFPNIVQEEVENRDWLDMFYAFSRLMVLVTLVYFYSSPLRCLIVIFFTILYYGYHVGYFRQLNREPNNNQPPNVAPPANNNENVAAPVVEQHPPPPPPQQQPQQPAIDIANNEENPINEAEPLVNAAASPTDNVVADNDSNRTPMIVLVRTFIMSFFASLIPETPAL